MEAHSDVNEETSQRVVEMYKDVINKLTTISEDENSSTLKLKPTILISDTTDNESNQDAADIGSNRNSNTSADLHKNQQLQVSVQSSVLINNEGQEVSTSFIDKADGRKVGPDHIKSMFGGLSMLAENRNTHKLGSFEAMSHAHVHAIRAMDGLKSTSNALTTLSDSHDKQSKKYRHKKEKATGLDQIVLYTVYSKYKPTITESMDQQDSPT
ncbi:hypothetical protein BDC45DRAFT_564097 [Circinella umbellata]|nr:hypothetical protein BDC45DRAFT_564097 [Circinella umbellata]